VLSRCFTTRGRRFGGITPNGTNLFIANTGNFTVRKAVIDTGDVTTLAGEAGISGCLDGTGTGARFNLPAGITTDGTDLFVVDVSNDDKYVLRRVAIATGTVTTLAGADGSLGSVTVIVPSVKVITPHDITTDGTNIFVADNLNFIIRKVAIATGVVTTLAGSAGNSGSADGIGTSAKFKSPIGITSDGTNLFVTDINDAGNYTIRKVVIASGAVSTLAGHYGTMGAINVMSPQGITTDGTNLFLADGTSNTIVRMVIATGAVTTVAGRSGEPGSQDGTGAVARFTSPQGITTDGKKLFVADFGNFTIRKID
jgi:hypothetical protein